MDMLDVAREIKEIIMLGMSNIYIYMCVCTWKCSMHMCDRLLMIWIDDAIWIDSSNLTK